MDDFFPKYSMKPNPDCDEYHCLKNQKAFAIKEAERLKNLPAEPEKSDEPENLHEENEWGICLEADDSPDVGSATAEEANVGEGLRLAYERRVTLTAEEKVAAEESNEQSLEDLMAQMKSM